MKYVRLVAILATVAGMSSPMRAAPAAPANLQTLVNGTTVSFTWTASPGASGYVLEAGSAPGLSNLATLTVPASPSYTVPHVPAGVYYVRVRALDGSGPSGPSNEVTVNVGGVGGPCFRAPDPPTRLRAVVDGTQVALSWQPAPTGCPVASYVLRAGSQEHLVDLAQLPVPGPTFSGIAPDGIYFVSVVAVNAYGVSQSSATAVVVVAAANASGRVGFNTATPAVVADEEGNAVVIAEVVNRSLSPAVFVEVSATLRDAQDRQIPAGSTFLRGHSRRLTATGTMDDSALAPGEIGCVYLQTSIPAVSVRGANLNVTHDSFASTAPRTKVDVIDFDRVVQPGPATLAVTVANVRSEPTYFNVATFYLKRTDGRAIGCDFAFVPTSDAALGPGQAIGFTATTHAPDNANTAVAWMQWQEAGDPLAGLAAQTYELMRTSPRSGSLRRHAVNAWIALQQQRRQLARQAGW